MNITMVQAVGHVDDPTANAFKIRMRVNNIESDLFIFPEMVMCGYVRSKDKMHLKVVEGREMDMIKEFSSKKGAAIICGGPRSDGDKVYNSAYFINGDDVSSYSKIHLPSDGFTDETKLFEPGKEPVIIEYKGIKFGLAMSHDIYFPELFRWYAKNGADMIICISAVPEEEQRRFEKIIPARAIENSMSIILVNMVGMDSGIKMAGGSMFVTSDGVVKETFSDSSDVRTLRFKDDDLKSKGGRPILEEVRTDISW